jgi:COP9 signalosome complex subunit 6
VGWYTLVPKTGPSADHLPIHNEILERYNESAILLGFHIQDVLDPVPGNPLPITIYESNYEAEETGKDAEGEDEQMKDSEAASKMVLRFRELPYSTETGEAEMIAMQFIREGVAHATRNDDSQRSTADKKGKGKQPATSQREPQAPQDEDANLSKDELEQISALQTKTNAIKMMRDRIGLLIAYLEKLDPEFIKSSQFPPAGTTPSGNYLPPSAKILRQIQALVTNIELVTPAQQDELEKEMLQETNDVKLISMIRDMFSTVSDIRDVGKKFAVVESNKAQKNRQQSNQQFADFGGGQQASLGNVGDIHLH